MLSLRKTLLTAAFLITCCCHAAAHADPLVLTLSNPVQTALAARRWGHFRSPS